jgi:hypothetical protein
VVDLTTNWPPADKRQQDLEAQKPADLSWPEDASRASIPPYSRAGRGGAGNFADPKTRSEAERQESETAEQAKARIDTGLLERKTVSLGRGGAGNWSDSASRSAPAALVEDEKRKVDAVEARVLQDVEATLKPPAPAYHEPHRNAS